LAIAAIALPIRANSSSILAGAALAISSSYSSLTDATRIGIHRASESRGIAAGGFRFSISYYPVRPTALAIPTNVAPLEDVTAMVTKTWSALAGSTSRRTARGSVSPRGREVRLCDRG
jgi:hypothetical protein